MQSVHGECTVQVALHESLSVRYPSQVESHQAIVRRAGLGMHLINPEGPKFLLQWINEILDRQIQQILEIILCEIVLLLV